MQDVIQIVEESIDLELNVAALYFLFHFAFPEDAAFWWQLHGEERNHAALLSSVKKTFIPADAYPAHFLPPFLDKLKSANEELNSLIEKYKKKPPKREEAFLVALAVENSAGEKHFQEFAEKAPQSKIDEAFHNLISHDRDHIRRIREYMERKGIDLPSKE